MGTDIHGVWQAKQDGRWVDIPSLYEQDRHYQLFAVLAGVRNGTGFAGCITGDPIEPISEPRGYPSDFAVVGDEHPIDSWAVIDPRRQKYRDHEDDDKQIWMGDHSHSWLRGEEMLRWYEHAGTIRRYGVISREVFGEWIPGTRPREYCGDITGRNVVVGSLGQPVPENWTHMRVSWLLELRGELSYFFEEVKRLVEIYGEIRFVFGFDS